MNERNEKVKNIIIGILIGIITCLVIALLFVSYNKFIVKDENTNSKSINNNSAKEEKNEDDNNKYILSTKYINAEDKESYISFDTTNYTWTHIRNMCEGYEKLNGTYYFENNKIRLMSDSFNDDKSSTRGAIVSFSLITNNLNHVEKILYTIEGNFNYVGCSGSDYFIAE